MNKKTTISCYLIGEGNLSIQCLELLQENGHRICGILSSDKALYEWAINHDIKHWETLEDWLSIVDDKSVDYIFSVVNPILLPKGALRKARHFAINYHDSLLPRHAGVHATVWAILNQETEHGITWHIVDSCIDTGDILKQVHIPIANDETTLSLNLNCQQAAIESFKVLIDELVTSAYARVPQDLSQRSYNASRKKTPGNGVINWNQPAKDIERLYRALSFGNHPNRLASLKLIVGTQCYLVTKLSILEDTYSSTPGQIINVCEEQIRVAAVGSDIIVTGLSTVTGEDVSGKKFISETNLKVGEKLKNISTSLQKQLVKVSEDIFKNEGYWVKQLRKGNAMPFPYLEHTYFDTQKCIVEETFEIPEIKKLSKKNIKIDIYFMTVWLIYLYRLNNYQPVRIGFKHAGIQHGISDNLKFLFTESVPLLAEFDSTISFAQAYEYTQSLINKIISQKTFLKDAFARYPTLKEVREPIHYPCQLTLDIQDFKVSHKITNTLNVDSKRGVYQICIHVNAKQKDWARLLLQRIHKHLITITKSSFSNPDATLVELELLTQQERCQILALSSTYDADEPYLHKTIPELFEEQVKRKPHATAILYQDNKITYATLNEYANLVANYLLQQGVKPKSPIAIYSYRCPEAIIAMLAILKIGAFYVPIDPDYPPERVRFIINDAIIHLGLTTKILKKQGQEACAKKSQVQWINVTSFMLSTNKKTAEIHHDSHANDVAYLLYTSGTTGKPKGVLVPQRGVSRLIKARKVIKFHSHDCVAQLSNLVFDASTFEIWGALLSGATLYILDKETALNPYHLASALHKNKCTCLFMTPSVFKEVIDAVPEAFDYLRLLLLGGESVYARTLETMIRRKEVYGLNVTLINGYGPTENTVFSTFYSINKVLSNNSIVPIGWPLPHNRVYILDKYQKLIPIGVTGELYLGGAGIAHGYLNRPELNKYAFIRNLFRPQQSTKHYRTGDKARWLSNGSIEFIGREDNQVKLRGMRIELGEIEYYLNSHPSVKQGVVLIQKYQEKQQRLIAFVILENEVNINIKPINQYLRQNLPAHMIPSQIINIDKLPITIHGKIDKIKLLEYCSLKTSNDYQTPHGNVEQILAEIWENIFNLGKISREDEFYQLGGDSIIAMRIVTRARQVNLSIKVADILTYTTIASLAPFVRYIKNNYSLADQISNGVIPLTPIQHWFFEANLQDPHKFSQHALLKISSDLDKDILQQALQQIIKHHDVFRINFNRKKSGFQQVLNKKSTQICIQEITINTLSKEQWYNFVEQYARKLQSSIRLEHPPLIKVAIIYDSSNTKYLLIVIHHLIIDGVSWRILLQDLDMSYKSIEDGNLDIKLPKTQTFADWCDYLSKLANTDNVTKEIDYWLEVAHNDFKLPVKCSIDTQSITQSSVVEMVLDEVETKKLLYDIPKNYRLKLLDVLISSFLATLYKWTRQEKIYLHLESHGRTIEDKHLDLSHTMGWFTCIYPLLVYLPLQNNKNFLVSLVKQVKYQLHKLPNKGMGYGILRYLNKQIKVRQQLKELSKNLISFNYLGQFNCESDQISFADKPISLINGKDNHMIYLIEVMIWIVKDQLHIAWHYNKKYFSKAIIQDLVKNNIRQLTKINKLIQSKKQMWVIPEDFHDVKVHETLLHKVIKEHVSIDNIFPLSPMQQGILFHTLQSVRCQDYLVQLNWIFRAELIIDAMIKTWEILINRHGVLRTKIIWRGCDEPIQIELTSAKLQWKHHNISNLSQKDQQKFIRDFLRTDREQGFDLESVPGIRINILIMNKKLHHIIITTHHIFLGGWSVSILFQEAEKIYHNLLKKQDYSLPRLTPYSEYIKWLSKQDLRLAKLYMENYLSDFKGSKKLPFLKSILPNTNRSKNITNIYNLSNDLTKQLNSFSRQYGVTLSTLFQGAWAYLISRYHSVTDVLFGITVSGREASLNCIENMVGLFINTLPLRIQVKYSYKVLEYLKGIQSKVNKIIDYHFLPLTNIRSLNNKSINHNMFDHIMVFENYPEKFVNDKNFNIRNIEFIDPTHYSLAIVIIPGDQFKVKFIYQEGLIDPCVIDQYMQHLQRVLSEIISSPYKNIHQFVLLSNEESDMLLKDLGIGNVTQLEDKTVQQLFKQQAIKSPNHIAITSENQVINYRGLDNRSDSLASFLKEKNANSGGIVAIYMDRGIEVIVSMLAVLKSGCAFLAIEPDLPLERIKYMLENSQVTTILSQSHYWFTIDKIYNNQKEEKKVNIYYLDIEDNVYSTPMGGVHPTGRIHDPAFIIYTSGSTGKPKGIIQTNQTIVNLVKWETSNIFSGNTLAQYSSLSFDLSIIEIFGALLNGFTLSIVTPQIKSSFNKLVHFLNKEKICILFLPTSILGLLLEYIDCEGIKIPYLKNIIVAGEQLIINNHIRNFFTKNSHVRLINQYGPAETHVAASYVMPKDTNKWNSHAPIGKPIPNTQLYVLNEKMDLLSIGEIGELYISGIVLSKGYLNQPNVTQQTFLPNHFKISGKMYKTGDLVRWLPNGNLEFIGRIDDQVKIGSVRIELREIEYQINQFSPNSQTCVLKCKNKSDDKYLVAYIAKGNSSNEMKLRKFLARHLPDYMVPKKYVYLDKLPTNNNGKIDKIALANLKLYEDELERNHIEPRTDVERDISKIWFKIFKIKRISIKDDFFDLGGHSLLALKLLSYIYRHFKIDLPIKSLFNAPTIEQQAILINEARVSKNVGHQYKEPLRGSLRNEALLELSKSGDKKPLFLIHPIGGTAFWYMPMVNYWSINRPLYAIQDPNLDAININFTRLEDMAQYYIELIRQIQSSGPYFLGGASAGGIIAIEMANQLQAQGEEVNFVGLLDSWALHPKELSSREIFEFHMRQQYQNMRDLFYERGILHADTIVELQWKRMQFLLKYKIKKIPPKIILFKAKDLLPYFKTMESPDNHWGGKTISKFKVCLVPGDHASMFQEPQVKYLTKSILTCLNGEIA